MEGRALPPKAPYEPECAEAVRAIGCPTPDSLSLGNVQPCDGVGLRCDTRAAGARQDTCTRHGRACPGAWGVTASSAAAGLTISVDETIAAEATAYGRAAIA